MPRPRGFDSEHVVYRAMELFWTQGYDATSVSDLTAVLGLHPGSMYRTFGDKHALFLRALERYRQSQARPIAPALLAGGPGLPRIRAGLGGLIELAPADDEHTGRPRARRPRAPHARRPPPRAPPAATPPPGGPPPPHNPGGGRLPGDNAVAGAVA